MFNIILFLLICIISTDLVAQRSNSGFGLIISTDRAIYTQGTPIQMTLKVFNYGETEVTLNFTTSQRYDFSITNNSGKEIWRWSKGKMFTQMMGDEVVGPGKRELVYQTKFEGTLKESTYIIGGEITTMEGLLGGQTVIQVKK